MQSCVQQRPMTDATRDIPAESAPFYERWWDTFDRTFRGRASHVTDRVAEAAHEHAGFSKREATKWIPWLGSGLVSAVGFLFVEPLTKVGRWGAGIARRIVTGNGYLERIPLVGGLFSLAGRAFDALGEIVGVAASAVASVVTFKMLQKDSPPDASQQTDIAGAVMPTAAAGALAAYSRPVVYGEAQRASPEAQLRNQLRIPPLPGSGSASQDQVKALKDLLGGGKRGEDNFARIMEARPLSESEADAVLSYLRRQQAVIREEVAGELLSGSVRRWIRINPVAQLRNIREATGIGTGFGRVAKESQRRMNTRLDEAVRTVKESLQSAAAERATASGPAEIPSSARMSELARGGLGFVGNMAGAGLFGYGAYRAAERTADSFEHGEVAGTLVAGTETAAAATGATVAAGKAFGRMQWAGNSLGPLAAVVTAADGTYRTLHEDTGLHTAQRGVQTAVETGLVVGADVAVKSAIAGGTRIAAEGGLAAAGTVALPFALAVGVGYDLWGIHQCLETGIETSRIYEAIDKTVSADLEKFSNLRLMSGRKYYLTADSAHLRDAVRDGQGNVDLTKAENIDRLRQAIVDVRDKAKHEVDNTSWFSTWRYLHFTEGQSEALGRFEARKKEMRVCDAALGELDALESRLAKAKEAKDYAASESKRIHGEGKGSPSSLPLNPAARTDRGV